MCQLLAMNCSAPTDIVYSFTGFKDRGGLTDHHKDGWGIAFFEGKGVRKFLDPNPSCTSSLAEFIKHNPIESKNVIGHIRRATQGRLCLENTHPFERELWGRYWIFAHNGHLKEFKPELNSHFRPVGDTDSELVFCFIMQSLLQNFGNEMPSQSALIQFIKTLVTQINEHGEFNFILSNGDFLLAHCSTRLSYLQRPFLKVHKAAVIATLPLTEHETWTTMQAFTLAVFQDGEMHQSFSTVPKVMPDFSDCKLTS